jgi:outer membrane protein
MKMAGSFGEGRHGAEGSGMRVLAGRIAIWTALVAPACFAAPAWGQLAPPASDWTVTIGVEGRVLPGYEGSDSSVLRPVPIFNIRRAGTPARFRGPRDGLGIGLIDTGRFRAGPAFKVKLPRDEGDNSDLRGLGNVDWTLEAGAFAEYWPTDYFRLRAELRQGIGGHHGLVGDLSADLVVPVTPQLTLSAGPRLTLATASAMSPYFDITPAQSAASGLPVYDAGGGVRSYGLGAQARYHWTPRWESHVFVEYQRLSDDAADSPLVSLRGSADQVQVGIGASYAFDVPGLW